LICQVFEKKRVLVVGCGETGLDLTYRAVIAPAKEVSLLARRGFLSVPTEGAGKGVPLDTMIPNLFESSYVHPWLEWCDRPASPHPLRAHARSFVVPQLPLASGGHRRFHTANRWPPIHDTRSSH